jgi:hypothetical protein
MAFGKRKPKAPVTTEQLIARHQSLAEQLLQRAAKGGRLEAETRLATMATAHATLAVSYLLSPPPEAVELDDGEDEETGEDEEPVT